MKFLLSVCLLTCLTFSSFAKDGHELWLDYNPVASSEMNSQIAPLFSGVFFFGESPSYDAIRKELEIAGQKMLGKSPFYAPDRLSKASLWIGAREQLSQVLSPDQQVKIKDLGVDGFWIEKIEVNGKSYFSIVGNKPVGLLYGVFHWLKSIQTGTFNQTIEITESPKVKLRMLNQWDNLDRTVERGYAGFSIWDWHKLPGYIDPRYTDHARANASIGINAVSLTNVNANALILTTDFMKKAKVLADLFRPYGIKFFVTALFPAPIEIGKLKTADPLDPEVIEFWKKKTDEMYSFIPDFGGFVVKANSEGQPGPQEYKRNHAEGANVLADAFVKLNYSPIICKPS